MSTRRRSLVLAAVLAVAACAPEPAGDLTAVNGLLVLAADADGAATLASWSSDPDAGTVAADIDLPGPATVWLSSGRGRVLAATLLDGTIQASDPVRGAGPLAWRPVEARDPGGERPPDPAWFVTWDPEGGRFATITGDLPGGDDLDLTLIDPSTGSAFVIPLGQSLLPAAPVWLDGDRVALVGGSTTEPVAVLVDTTTSEVTDGPAGDRRLATSADGTVIATTGAPGSPVVVHATAAWEAGDGTSIGAIRAPSGEAQAASMALDAGGQRLAIVWQGLDDGLRVDVHARAADWRRITTLPVTGRAAAIAWSR
jgi:hypothetical protein